MRAVVFFFLLVAARPGVMSLRDSQTEDLSSLGRHGFRSGPARQTLIPTPHNSPVCLLETCTCQETRAKQSERETEEARTGPNE